MDWQTLLWVGGGGLIVLFFVMMRGCGGMAGRCGMGSRPRDRDEDGRRDESGSDRHRAA